MTPPLAMSRTPSSRAAWTLSAWMTCSALCSTASIQAAGDPVAPTDCAVNQLAATNSTQISLPLMRALDAYMAQSQTVSSLRDIYWAGSSEIVRMFAQQPQVFEAARAALVELQPAVAAYLSGKADQFVISQSLADRLSTIYDLLWQYGGEALRPSVTKARVWFNAFDGLAGKTLAEIGPGFGFAPLSRPFLHLSGARLRGDHFVLDVNRIDGLDYSIWHASTLAPNAWSQSPEAVISPDGLGMQVTIPRPSAHLVFYQVRAGSSYQQIALPEVEESAFEFMDKSTQDGLQLRHYGYLTRVAGLSDAELFSDPVAQDERSARFTFVAETTIRQRHTLGNLIQTAADGPMTIYVNDTPTGTFDRPETFTQGRVIAKLVLRYHNALTVTKENEGINAASATFEITESLPFTFNGRPLQWARAGTQGRVEINGPGFRTAAEPLAAFFYLSGYAVISQR